MHLVPHTTTLVVVVGVGEMTGVCTDQMITRLRGDDVEQIGLGSPVADEPLGGVGIDGCWRRGTYHPVAVFPRRKQQYQKETHQSQKR